MSLVLCTTCGCFAPPDHDCAETLVSLVSRVGGVSKADAAGFIEAAGLPVDEDVRAATNEAFWATQEEGPARDS